MADALADDQVENLLKAGYAAPPIRDEFARRLGTELARRSVRHTRFAATSWRPAALAASVVLAVTLTVIGLRPDSLDPRPTTAVAQVVEPDAKERGMTRWAVAQPWMRWGESAGGSQRGDHKLGEPAIANFHYQPQRQADDHALHLFFAMPPQSLGRAGTRPNLKEPPYQSQAPRYGLLVFGPEAKTRVWIVLDLVSEPYDPKGSHDALYVDRNGNGDLTGTDERVPGIMKEHKYVPFVSFAGYEPKEVTQYIPTFKIGDIVERDGKTRHTDVAVEVGEYLGQLRTCKVTAKVNGREQRVARDYLLRFSKRPEDAPIIHFNGPLAMHLSMETGTIHVPVNYEGGEWDPPRREVKHLVRGKEAELYAEVGTPGVGAGSFLALTADVPPKDAHPVAVIEFPHQDAKQPAIKVQVALKGRC